MSDRCKHCETPIEDDDEVCCDGKALEIADKVLDDIWDQCRDAFTDSVTRISKITNIIREHSHKENI
jgi:hypothetical protein